VKTNKEYQSLLKEIEDVKIRNSKVEDEMIECLDSMDDAEKAMASDKNEYLRLAAQIKSEKEDILQAAEQSKQKLAELENDRKGVSDKIDSGLFKKYDLLKESNKGGLAVVPVKDALCHGCNVNLPPQLYNELYRGDTLKFCPNCQRIIYWEGS
jgi:predicted  nucleic acid-binding Zn-ribbon protein